jgi:hypothetical protein
VTTKSAGQKPTGVPPMANRVGQDPRTAALKCDWSWSEPTVWTARMLAALEVGVKGGKWYSLIDKAGKSSKTAKRPAIWIGVRPGELVGHQPCQEKSSALNYPVATRTNHQSVMEQGEACNRLFQQHRPNRDLPPCPPSRRCWGKSGHRSANASVVINEYAT